MASCTDGNRFTFQGREASYSTGLMFFRSRYYSAALGRWLSKDKIGIDGGHNLHEAFGSNPVNFTDAFGTWAGWASGEPVSSGESLVPVWGSGRQAINDYSTGHYVWGSVNTAMAVSDIFLIKSAATMVSRGAWKAGSATWGATRKWLGKRGYAESGQHVHHGVVPREAFEGTSWEKVFNQPWNLKSLEPRSGFSMDRWHKMIEGKRPGLNSLEKWWYGTPDWLRYAEISGAGRLTSLI